MYPSNSNNGNDPISYSHDQTLFFHRTFLNDINNNNNNTPNSKQEDPPPPPPLSFFSFPSPFEDDDVFLQQPHDLLFHQQSLMRADNMNAITETVANMVDSTKNHNTVTDQIPRKRSSKRDRHSKINTLRGPRDRRMRLSLEVAHKFFGLQDMLGYDKASKTVEWLLIQAKAEIKKLNRELKRSCSIGAAKSASSTSECEVVSGIDEVAIYRDHQQGSVSEEKPLSLSPTKEKKAVRQSRKSAFHPLAKESRAKARARAKERTEEKMRSRRRLEDESKLCDDQTTNCDLSLLGCPWSPFETGEESGTQSHNNMNTSALEMLPTEVEVRSSSHHHHVRDDHDHHLGASAEEMVGDDSLVMGRCSPSLIFNPLQNTGISLEQHQYADFQLFGIPAWEVAYNNHNLC